MDNIKIKSYKPFIYLTSHGSISRTKKIITNFDLWYYVNKGEQLLIGKDDKKNFTYDDAHSRLGKILFDYNGKSDDYNKLIANLEYYLPKVISSNSLTEQMKLWPAIEDIKGHTFLNYKAPNFVNSILYTMNFGTDLVYLRLIFNLNLISNNYVSSGEDTFNNKSNKKISVEKGIITKDQFIYIATEYREINKIKNTLDFIELSTFLNQLSKIHILLAKKTNSDSSHEIEYINAVEENVITSDSYPDKYDKIIDLTLPEEINIIMGTCRGYYD